MKLLIALSFLSLTGAAPLSVERRQFGGLAGLFGGGGGTGAGGGPRSGQTCLVYARGSTEVSPMGWIIGPGLQSSLKLKIPGLQVFPVMYEASLFTNVRLERTDSASMDEGVKAFNKAESAGCQVIVAGGYSQGAAVMHNVIQRRLGASTKQKIAGVALFGDTLNTQDSGHIRNFPKERSKVWCNSGDGVCDGGLAVNGAHLSYGAGTISEATNWLMERVSALARGG